MKECLTIIGSFILAYVIVAIPSLAVLSICLSWSGGITTLLCVLTFWDVIILAGTIKDYSEYLG